ncbi:MAG TPA: PEP/pyruvate-binding domain-containing protein [Candidatus Limnocylindria bacterium]|nr:PEP/pyruvate-binding domain-containing protein [Candidatus Limnocylindria bacterium]
METAFLGDAASRDAQQVGAKAATLSRLADRFRVPAGFCLDASVFDRLSAALDGDPAALTALRALVAEGHAGLRERTGHADPAVAVRSSAIGEDGGESSFAGQHETILNVRGVDAIVDAVRRCWRSASSDRAVAYRKERGVTDRPRVAVLVQELVPADAAAIVFSADPVTGDRETLVIDATVGLGEAIAAGTTTPDTYAVRKADLAMLKRTLAGARPALTDEQVREVARLALALEAESGGPVDVECAFAAGTLYLLQSRPITTLGSADPFPVEWDDAADATLTWTQEQAHMADCRPVLACDFVLEAPAFGLDKANEALGPPVRVRYRGVRGYMYFTNVPLVPEDTLAAEQARGLERRRALARTLRRDWDERYLPTVLAHFRWMREAGADQVGESAARTWDEFWIRINDTWRIHMLVVGPAYSVLQELANLYAALTGGPATDGPILVQARADTLYAMQHDLHELAATLRRLPQVAHAISGGAARSLDDVRALEGGAPAGDAIAAFVARYGDAGQAGFDIESPAWADDPSTLLAEVRRLISSEPSEDPAARRTRLLQGSDALATRTRALLRDRPADLARFDEVLAAARGAGPLSEEHNYWIDRLCQAHARRFILRVGAALADAGRIARAYDVMHLHRDEVRDALAAGTDQRALVVERRREFALDQRRRAPRTIGAPRPVPVPLDAVRDLGYQAEQTDMDLLRGVAASPGRGRGPVRMVTGPADFERFQRGDVLVCRSTTVSWVPLFNSAAAIVADIGGALSHAAVVAREFGVPAVCGTGTALETLIDGELVEVDGTAGTVRRIATKI